MALATTSGDGVTLPLSGRWPLWKAFVHRHARLLADDPERAAGFTTRLRRYEEERLEAGLSDAEVAAGHRRSSTWEVVLEVVMTALELPPAVVGTVLNWVPFRFAGWVARSFGRLPDEPATYKIMSAIVAFPVSWVLEAVVAARLWGLAAGLAVLLVAPASGYAALLFNEERLRPFKRRRGRPPEALWSELRSRRADLQREILQLGAEDA